MRHITTTAALVCALALATGCGGDDAADETPSATATETSASATPTPTESAAEESESPTAEPEPAGTLIEITLAGGKVTPAGDRVRAVLGEPITLRVDADVAGELHVHATPEVEIAFDAGTSEHEITLDQPGVVEVELHDPPLVVVQIEVR